MSTADLRALAPVLVLGVTVVAMLLVAAWLAPRPQREGPQRASALLALLGLAAALASLPFAAREAPRQIGPLLLVDDFTLFYSAVILAGSLAVVLLAIGYLRHRSASLEEFNMLVVLAALGAAVLVASTHFVSLFLGLELLSIALYALIAYERRRRQDIEAGLKYLVLASSSSAFLLFGMALIYVERGSMSLIDLARALDAGAGQAGVLLLVGLGLIVVGLGYKLALVPFHLWTPDVYQGAPAPVTAFIATVSKGAVFGLLLRFYMQAGGRDTGDGALFVVLAGIAVASMFFGNLLALLQQNVKRILAYSSIAQLGYMLVALLAGGAGAATFYLVAYVATILAAFGVVTVLSGPERDAESIEDYRGMFWRRPWLALVMTAALLSLIGMPLTAGFIGKFYVLAAGVDAAQWWLVLSLVVSSAIGVYYYLRIIVAMFLDADREKARFGRLPVAGSLVLIAATVAVVWLGVYPAPLLNAIRAVVSALG